MRQLTFPEARQVEKLRASIAAAKDKKVVIEVLPSERELWLNLLDMVLETNEALSAAWRQSPNTNAGVAELLKNAFSE